MLPLFNPKDVKCAFLNATAIAAGATQNVVGFNNSKVRYLIGFAIGNTTPATISPFTVEDQNGNLLGADPAPGSAPAPFIFVQPFLVGVPGQNGIQIHNQGAAADTVAAVVWYADVDAPLTSEIFRS